MSAPENCVVADLTATSGLGFPGEGIGTYTREHESPNSAAKAQLGRSLGVLILEGILPKPKVAKSNADRGLKQFLPVIARSA
jgi:hypothetical protein